MRLSTRWGARAAPCAYFPPCHVKMETFACMVLLAYKVSLSGAHEPQHADISVVSGSALEVKGIEAAMSNSFGFGGLSVCLPVSLWYGLRACVRLACFDQSLTVSRRYVSKAYASHYALRAFLREGQDLLCGRVLASVNTESRGC